MSSFSLQYALAYALLVLAIQPILNHSASDSSSGDHSNSLSKDAIMAMKNDSTVLLPDAQYFINRIFGAGVNTMTVKDVENIMTKLNLRNLSEYDMISLDSNNFSSCFMPAELTQIYRLNPQQITKNDFSQMCSSLIRLATTPECKTDFKPREPVCAPRWEKYLFGAISIIVIWAVSILACVIIGRVIRNPRIKKILLLSLRSLAVGVLLSDAFMHLVPEALGMHGDASHAEPRDPHDALWKMTVWIATIFFLWIFESLLSLKAGGHGHSHGAIDDLDTDSTTKHSIESISESTARVTTDANGITSDSGVKLKFTKENGKNILAYMKTIQATGWIAILGDVLHKAVDGLAIGAAFSQSISLGISTCLAIFFHEIPHELGEYGVLIKSGMTHCTILLLNSFTSFFTLVGFFIIVSINIQNQVVVEYIFAIIGGVFVYIALVIMVPGIKEELGTDRAWKPKIFVVVFFIIGWLILLILSLVEDLIQFDFGTNC